MRIKRAPDFIIGEDKNPYLLRWWLTPHNPEKFRVYLHKFMRDDDDRALHDHPSNSISFILWGGYKEHLRGGKIKRRYPGMVIFRRADTAHRIELFRDKKGNQIPAWTLFIFGKKIREWGFLCPKGWRHNKIFCSAEDSGKIGIGCD